MYYWSKIVIFTPMSQNSMTACLLRCWTDPSRHGLCKTDEGVFSGIKMLQQKKNSNHVDCKVELLWIELVVGPAHPTIGLRYGEFGGQGNTLNSSSYSSNHSRIICAMWVHYPAERGHFYHGKPLS